MNLQVGVDGASTTVEVTLPKGAKGEGSAILSGFSLSTQHELADGPSCYDPRYGWHPRQITIALGDVVVDGDKATVPVEATFSAKTFDPDRRSDRPGERPGDCRFVGHRAGRGRQGRGRDAAAHGRGELPVLRRQELPGGAGRPWLDPACRGRSPTRLGFIDFRFDPDRTDDWGAYLRTFGFWAKPDGTANAFATNYSPGSQLQDFGFHFDGDVVAIEHLGTVERGSSTGTFPAALDEAGEPLSRPSTT